MPKVLPSQALSAIKEMFPGQWSGSERHVGTVNVTFLRGALRLVQEVPPEFITLESKEYADLTLSLSMIESTIKEYEMRFAHGHAPQMPSIGSRDTIAIIAAALGRCRDDYPPASDVVLGFVTDPVAAETLARDVGAARRALVNGEWKAATILAGSAIEALLHWRLNQPPTTEAEIRAACIHLFSAGAFKSKPDSDRDRWSLDQFIKVSEHLTILGQEVANTAHSAQDFRNLIHPGYTVRAKITCDRGTAYSAAGGLENVIRELGKP